MTVLDGKCGEGRPFRAMPFDGAALMAEGVRTRALAEGKYV
jgi:hypothetical protein